MNAQKLDAIRTFTVRPDLNDQIQTFYKGERPYKCTDCNNFFLVRFIIRIAMNIASDAVPVANVSIDPMH